MISLPGTEHIPHREPQTRIKSAAPEFPVSEPSPSPPPEPEKHQTEAGSQAETEDVAAEEKAAVEVASDGRSGVNKEETQEQERLEEEKRRADEAAEEEEVEVDDAGKVGEPDVDAEVEVESEKEQATERDVDDSVLLSEKERQNEEVNEKDNCSASSISSTSSTLEREEREVKLNHDIEAGTKFRGKLLFFSYFDDLVPYLAPFYLHCFHINRSVESVH